MSGRRKLSNVSEGLRTGARAETLPKALLRGGETASLIYF
jgi:hypothetical protein